MIPYLRPGLQIDQRFMHPLSILWHSSQWDRPKALHLVVVVWCYCHATELFTYYERHSYSSYSTSTSFFWSISHTFSQLLHAVKNIQFFKSSQVWGYHITIRERLDYSGTCTCITSPANHFLLSSIYIHYTSTMSYSDPAISLFSTQDTDIKHTVALLY